MALYALHTTSPPRNMHALFPLLDETNLFAPTTAGVKSTAHRKASTPTTAAPDPPPHGKNPVVLPSPPSDTTMCLGFDRPSTPSRFEPRKLGPRKPEPHRSEPRRSNPRKLEPPKSESTKIESIEPEPEPRKPESRSSESTEADSITPVPAKPESSKSEPTKHVRKLTAWKCPNCSCQNKGSNRHCTGNNCRKLDPRRKPAKGTLLSKCCGCRHLSKRFNEACSKCVHQQEGCDRCSVVRVGGRV